MGTPGVILWKSSPPLSVEASMKLSDRKRATIRRLFAMGMSQRKVAMATGTSRPTVKRVQRGCFQSLPTEEEIRRMCLEIQDGWTPAVRLKRIRGARGR